MRSKNNVLTYQAIKCFESKRNGKITCTKCLKEIKEGEKIVRRFSRYSIKYFHSKCWKKSFIDTRINRRLKVIIFLPFIIMLFIIGWIMAYATF